MAAGKFAITVDIKEPRDIKINDIIHFTFSDKGAWEILSDTNEFDAVVIDVVSEDEQAGRAQAVVRPIEKRRDTYAMFPIDGSVFQPPDDKEPEK